MNNKGMTLVELIITFSLLMIVIIGMFNLILNTKFELDDKQMIKEIVEYSNFLNNDIHYDLISKKPIAIAIKRSPLSKWTCQNNNKYNFAEGAEECKITNSTLSISAFTTHRGKAIPITGSKSLENICNNYYSCAVYAYHDPIASKTTTSLSAKFKIIAINNNKTKVTDGYGVQYGNTYEVMPNQDYIDVSKLNSKMKLGGGYFIIDYPIYLIDDNTNYGFKISYPFN